MPIRKFSELLDSMPANRRQKITERVRETIAAMPLEELRKARQMTQAKLAQSLGVNQGEVSKIEHRTDLYLSTLSEYVEAMGGRLEIRAVFPDREVRITQFEEITKEGHIQMKSQPGQSGRCLRPGLCDARLHP